VPTIPGVLSAERFRALRALWPQVAKGLAAWRGMAIADLGRLQAGNPALPVAQASTVVLLLTTANLEGLYHVRDRVAELSGTVGLPGRARSSLGVVVTGELQDRRSSCEQVRQVLASIGSPAPVVGFMARDPAGARGLWAGELTRRFAGSDLVRSVRETAESVLASWPELRPIADPAITPPAAADESRAGSTQATRSAVMEGATP